MLCKYLTPFHSQVKPNRTTFELELTLWPCTTVRCNNILAVSRIDKASIFHSSRYSTEVNLCFYGDALVRANGGGWNGDAL